MSRKKITPITEKDINAIINNSVQGVGNRLVGSAAEQKKLFVRPIANTDGTPNVASLVKRLAAETEEAIREVENEVEDLQDSLTPPPPADSIPLSGVYLNYDRETETIEVLGSEGVGDTEVREIVEDETSEKFSAVESAVSELDEGKQDKLVFADGYNAEINKVATEATVAKEVAKVVGGAGESFDTLKEIADWITAHPNSVAEINAKIAENSAKINIDGIKIAQNESKIDRNAADIASQGQRVSNIQSQVNSLASSKQEKIEIADEYNATTNKVATEKTVANEIAKVVGGADASFDTLKEIADWIKSNPDSVAAINALLAEHGTAISQNANLIAENANAIAETAEVVQAVDAKATNNANAVSSVTTRMGIAEADIAALRDNKQNALAFADEYNAYDNKVATERTVSKEVAKIVADAPNDFDTLKEIAAWITNHPNDIAMINSLIAENKQSISNNARLIGDNARAISANATKSYANEIAIQDAKELIRRTQETAEAKLDKTTSPNKLYGTDEYGNPAFYPTDSVGTQVLVDGQKVKEFNADSKQDVIEFDGGYDKDTNKAATVRTVSDKIAEVIAGAPNDYDTLEEIARWIQDHPNSVAEINARIAVNTESITSLETGLKDRVKYSDIGMGFGVSDNGYIYLDSNFPPVQYREGYAVTGKIMDDAWKEVATNNKAKWEAADWEKFYAFIGAVKDYHTNRNGIARFNDGKLDVTDGLVNSSSPHAVNGRVLYKHLGTAKSEAIASANNYTDAQVEEAAEQAESARNILAGKLTGQIYNSAKYNSYKSYSGPGGTINHELVPGGFYMIFSGKSDLKLVDSEDGSVIQGARHMIFMTVPYSATAKQFVAIGMYVYDGSFSITNPKIPMEFFQLALNENSYVTTGDSAEIGKWTVAQHVGGINE